MDQPTPEASSGFLKADDTFPFLLSSVGFSVLIMVESILTDISDSPDIFFIRRDLGKRLA